MHVEIFSTVVLYPKAVDRIQLEGLTFIYIFSLNFLSPEIVLCSLMCSCHFVLVILTAFCCLSFSVFLGVEQMNLC